MPMRINDRAEQVLRIANLLGGGITTAAIYAGWPDVQRDVLRRLLAKLVARGALVVVHTPSLGGRAYLTRSSEDGRESGVRHFLRDHPDQLVEALETGRVRKTVALKTTFVHDQIAAIVALGLSSGVAEFERQMRQQNGPGLAVADGYAWPESDRRVAVEVERMVGQSPHRWQQSGGLVEKVVKSFVPDNSHPDWIDEYVVVSPRSINRLHPDVSAELSELVVARAAKNYKNRPDAGWWFLSIDDINADPEWHPIVPGTAPMCPLPGIRSRRDAFEAAHAERAKIDAERKAKAAEREAAAPPEGREAQGGFAADSAPAAAISRADAPAAALGQAGAP